MRAIVFLPDGFTHSPVRDPIRLEPSLGYAPECCFAILIPVLAESEALDGSTKKPKRTFAADGIKEFFTLTSFTQLMAVPLHDRPFVNIESVRQLQALIRFHGLADLGQSLPLPFRQVTVIL